ncbi:MFS transporter [Microbacter sp. GSS18]|nr:MFS transporter [Microbacter sp. GSS18]
MGLTISRLGIVIAAYWAASALFSPVAGTVSGHLGSKTTMIIAAALGSLALIGIALVHAEWWWMLALLALAGVANAFGHPPSNALIADQVSGRNRALAYGVKQAAIPLATMLAGLAVPTLALTMGWRWTFVIAAAGGLCVLLVLALVVPGVVVRTRRGAGRRRLPRGLMRFLVLTSLASGLGSAQANVVGAFTVSTGVAIGVPEGMAGLILSLGSVAGAIARPLVGWLADRGIGGTLATVAAMLSAGMLGALCIATGLPIAFAIGCVLAFGLGWGWNGLIHYVVSHVAYPHSARATGIVQSGAYIGSAAGPFLFGFVFDSLGVTLGWLIAAAVSAVAALMALLAHTRRPTTQETEQNT